MSKPRSRLIACVTGVSAGKGGCACGDYTLQTFRHNALEFLNKFVKKAKNCRPNCSSKKIAITAIFLFSATSSATSSATDYYWWINYWGFVDWMYATPMGACNKWANEASKSSSGKLKYTAISTVAETRKDRRLCKVSVLRTADGYITSTNVLVARGGDSCSVGTVYNPTTGECANDPDKGNCNSCPCPDVLDPINAALGNSIQTEVDSPSSNLSTLHFTRTYNSLDGLWRHNHSTYLRLTPSAVALVMADGRESFFTLSGSMVTASPTELGKLVKLTDGWQYTAKNNDTYSFDATGRLTRRTNAAGAVHQLIYDNGTVTVIDNLGQSLSYTEDAQHQPLTLNTAGLAIQYEYNASKRLSKLTRTRGGQAETRLFHYEVANKPDLLTGITDERGVRYTTWTFDAQDRATSSEHAGGVEHGDVTYNADGSSTVTNEFGKKSTYRFVTIDGVRRVSAIEGEALGSCAMSNSTFTYDARGLLKTKTDNKGHLTTYDYNTRGLEVSRTEAAGTAQARTITTDWHPTLFLPVTITEPTRITTYTYDAQGRQLSQSVTQR